MFIVVWLVCVVSVVTITPLTSAAVSWFSDKVPSERVKLVTETIMKLQEYVTSMQRLQVDATEYAYLKVLTLFSPGRHCTV